MFFVAKAKLKSDKQKVESFLLKFMAKILAPDSLKNKNTLFSFALYLFSKTISKKISTFKENWKLERSRVPHCTSLAGICISPIDRFAPIGSWYSIARQSCLKNNSYGHELHSLYIK